jgi:hypothetical protein
MQLHKETVLVAKSQWLVAVVRLWKSDHLLSWTLSASKDMNAPKMREKTAIVFSKINREHNLI